MTTEQCRCLRQWVFEFWFPFPPILVQQFPLHSRSRTTPSPFPFPWDSHGKMGNGNSRSPYRPILYYKQSCFVSGSWDMNQMGEVKFGWVGLWHYWVAEVVVVYMFYRLHVGTSHKRKMSRCLYRQISSPEVPPIGSRVMSVMDQLLNKS